MVTTMELTMDSMLHLDLDLSQRLSLPDANNNNSSSGTTSPGAKKPSEKYQLRPRSTRRCKLPTTIDDADDESQPSAATTTTNASSKGRSRCRQRPAPLSKYRRKTANARERSRMREINAAFEALRKAVPGSGGAQHPAPEKVTKIATLRLAMRYIKALSAALSDNEDSRSGSSSGGLFPPGCNFDLVHLESDGESGGPLASPAGFSDEPSLSPVTFDDPLLFQSDFNDQVFLEDDFGDFL